MWKICRKTIFPRWHTRKQNPTDKNDLKCGLAQSSGSHTAANSGRKYSKKDDDKQHADRHNNAFWEDPQYRCTINPTWLETLGLIGTAAAVGLNAQHRNLKQLYSNDGLYVCKNQKTCRQICNDFANFFTKYAWSMPKAFHCYALPQETSTSGSVNNGTNASHSGSPTDLEADPVEASLKEMRQISNEYVAETNHNLGLKLLKTDASQAFKLFQSAAKLGHPKALFNLGLCYETGKGTKVDFKKAGECYVQAALKGHRYALYNIGVYHIKGIGNMPKNEKVGLQFFRKAADQGVSEAQVYLGLHYLEKEKWRDAFNMFRDSEKQNNVDGKYYLGMCYENGWGVAQNEKMAVEMYIGAAFRGHDDAIFTLGQYYENGRGGLVKNEQLAIALYQIIADKGHLDAANALNVLKNKPYPILRAAGTCEILAHESTPHGEQVMKSPKVGLRESASSPELRNYDSFILPDPNKFGPSPHLDVVVPYSPISEKCSFGKPLLCSNFNQSIFPTFSVMNWNGPSSILTAGT